MAFDGYAHPKHVEDRSDCFFYHSIDLPEAGAVPGIWDLRPGVESYLGGVDFKGKRVLELGCANGFLTFQMERRGAEVVGVDLSESDSWDVVPYASVDYDREMAVRRNHIRQLNNAFWLGHRLTESGARVLYGGVYQIPPEAGPFDVCTVGSILLHLRDPFLALHRALSITRETVVVTDMRSRYDILPRVGLSRLLPKKLRRPSMRFIPDYRTGFPRDTWWRLNPDIVTHFLGVLGFEDVRVSFHRQIFKGRYLPLFTVVGRRTKGEALCVPG